MTTEKFGLSTIDPDSRNRAWVAASVVILAAYLFVYGWSAGFSLNDFPNHLARAVVMSDLLFQAGHRFGALFAFQFSLVPYVLGDLTLAGAVELFGVRAAGAFWTALAVASLPVALLFYLNGKKLAPRAPLLLFLLSLYLATDAFLSMGLVSFRFGVAAMLVALALAERLREGWSNSRFATYCVVVALTYLTHLSGIFFLAAALGVSALLGLWTRDTTVWREVRLAAPIALVAAAYLVSMTSSHTTSDLTQGVHWVTWQDKLDRLAYPFRRFYGMRYDWTADRLLMLLFATCIAWPAFDRLRRGTFMTPAAIYMLLLAATFVVMYLALPESYGDASYLDSRSLTMVPIFLAIACLGPPVDKALPDRSGLGRMLPLAALLATANLVGLSLHLVTANAWLERYRAVVAAIPERADVLPVYTGAEQLRPFIYASAFTVIDRTAFMPYLFSGNNGNPQTYFRYTRMHYAPGESWYFTNWRSDNYVDWPAVACGYDYLLVTKPFDRHRLSLAARVIADNDSATLLAIQRRQCAAGM